MQALSACQVVCKLLYVVFLGLGTKLLEEAGSSSSLASKLLAGSAGCWAQKGSRGVGSGECDRAHTEPGTGEDSPSCRIVLLDGSFTFQ